MEAAAILGKFIPTNIFSLSNKTNSEPEKYWGSTGDIQVWKKLQKQAYTERFVWKRGKMYLI